MDGLSARLHAWWATLSPRERRQASAVALIAFGYIVHYAVFCIVQPFFIEDAAITFAYARNLAQGEGFVTFPGGERVEGFSNALWTFLLAGLRGLGVPTWTGAKLLGGVLGVVTLPIAFDLVRRLRPDRDDDVALIAPLLLAASPQFVIWNASGLENSLFCVLLASGVWRLERELAGDARGVWSALLFVGLAMTRPEGVAYAVFAGAALMLDAKLGKAFSVLVWTVLVVGFLIVNMLAVAIYTTNWDCDQVIIPNIRLSDHFDYNYGFGFAIIGYISALLVLCVQCAFTSTKDGEADQPAPSVLKGLIKVRARIWIRVRVRVRVS